MRDVLLKRVRPLVERLAADLTELAVRRVEAELERMGEAFEVALSSYASGGAPDLLTAALGPELASMLTPKRAKRERDVKPANAPRATPARAERAPTPASANRRTCGCAPFGRHRKDCRTARPAQVARAVNVRVSDTPPADVTAATPQTARRLSAKPEAVAARRDVIAARAAKPAPRPDDDDDERWSPDRIAKETAYDEGHKRKGVALDELDVRASFDFGGA